jgi:hypothetical protein
MMILLLMLVTSTCHAMALLLLLGLPAAAWFLLLLPAHSTLPHPTLTLHRRYQDRGLPFCYVGYFDGMEEGVLRANVIEAKVNDVSVRYERPRAGEETDNEVYSHGDVIPAERIIAASGFRVSERVNLEGRQS